MQYSFPLQVDAEICYRTSHKEAKLVDRAAMNNGGCCADKGKYVGADGACKGCPEGPSPRLNGYYCESCPIGYEPKKGKEAFGCLRCKRDTFKDKEGNMACIACPAGQTTNSTIGAAACIKKQG